MKKHAPVPPPLEAIEEMVQKNTDGWVAYFKGLSPRIIVRTPSDLKFQSEFEGIEIYIKESFELTKNLSEIELNGWPKIKNVAFVVSFNSSMQKEKKEFLARNTYIFCYDKRAFGIDYFERSEHVEGYSYDLAGYTKSALSWEYISSLIKKYIIELEQCVPTPPKT